jgi:hypothetical protein
VGGGQIEVGGEDAMAALDRLLGVFERFVETPEAEFSVGAQIESLSRSGRSCPYPGRFSS